MKVIIKSTEIELTEDQIKKIESRQKEIEQSLNSFTRVLKLFGFKKVGKNDYVYNKWYAEIMDHGGWHSVWMTGHGLKQSYLFPGGWVYHSPKELSEELSNAINS